jgi:hypothetical protein|tara:strand:+ start:1035 stop:1520 length:486 start_codon:yes stop_codon:yes gene_type:complete
MTKLNFDADQVLKELPEEDRGFEPLPSAWYEAQISASNIKPTKAGTGEYLELTFDIIGDQYTGRKVWTRLNLENPNETTVRIAKQDLAKICKAVKLSHVEDSMELHGKPMQIKVQYKEGEGDYGPSNDIKDYKSSALGVGTQGSSSHQKEDKEESPSWANI